MKLVFHRFLKKKRVMKNKSIRIFIAISLILYSIFKLTQILEQNDKKQYFSIILDIILIICYLIGAVFQFKNANEKFSMSKKQIVFMTVMILIGTLFYLFFKT